MAMDADTKASIDRFKAEMKRRSEMVHGNIGKAVTNACQVVENTAKLGMTNTATDPDKAYPRQQGKKMHYASQDFDYPAVDTGTLRRSITHDVSEHALAGTGAVIGRVGSNLRYASFLETGTSKMNPRPWLKPSIAINREKIHALFSGAMRGQNVEIGDVETK